MVCLLSSLLDLEIRVMNMLARGIMWAPVLLKYLPIEKAFS